MAKVTVTSGKYKLNTRDFVRGALLSVISAVVTSILNSLQAGQMTIDLKAVGIVAITTFLSYLLKNYLEPQQVIVQGEIDENTPITDERAAKALGRDFVG